MKTLYYFLPLFGDANSRIIGILASANVPSSVTVGLQIEYQSKVINQEEDM